MTGRKDDEPRRLFPERGQEPVLTREVEGALDDAERARHLEAQHRRIAAERKAERRRTLRQGCAGYLGSLLVIVLLTAAVLAATGLLIRALEWAF